MKYDNLYLRKRPNYDEMIDNIVYENPKLKYPNRLSTFFRNSPYGSQFDGDNSFINLEEQQNNIMKERIIQETLKKMSSDQGLTHTAIQARYGASERPSNPTPSEYDDAFSDFTGMADEELERRELEKRAKDNAMAKRVKQDLVDYRSQEQASSSTSKTVYPTGVNAPPLPRQRVTERKGTRRETDDPEGVPRRITKKTPQ